jgi:hemolysin D
MSFRHRIQAWAQLKRRYADVFGFYWKNRRDTGGRFFNEDEAAFLPAALAIQERPVSSTARLVGRLLVAFIVLLAGWAMLGEIDVVANASGKIISSSRAKTIASVETASVKAIHVTEGQAVKAGQLLVELDGSALEAERDKALVERAAALLQTARARAMIDAVKALRPPHMMPVAEAGAEKNADAQRHLASQYHDFDARLRHLDGEIQRHLRTLPLVTERASDLRDLERDSYVSRHAYLDKEQARLEAEAQLDDARNRRAELIADALRQANELLTDGQRAAASLQLDAARTEARRKLLRLSAPVGGTVQQLALHTVGGVVPAAQPLMIIVPSDGVVEVEALLENKDVGFVKEGQDAAVKIAAFDYTKYGTIPSRVAHLSRDAVQDERGGLMYSARIALARSDIDVQGTRMPLNPGMAVDVEIKTGSRRVIEYVLSPLLVHKRESFNER